MNQQNPFDAWREAHKEAIAAYKELPERLKKMHAAYGAVPNKKCAECRFLLRVKAARGFEPTCQSGGEVRRKWNTEWLACGKFEPIRKGK